MIGFRNVSKAYRLKSTTKYILRDFSLDLPRGSNIGIIGRNGAGKSTFLRLISGTIHPDQGVVERAGRVSWPMGFSGGFHPALTGRQNARFVARIYGTDTDDLVEEVEDFAELGAFLDMPYRTYSSGMRARLAFGVSLAANFDCYLVDEITAVGDAIFKKKCQAAFETKMARAQVIMVSHNEATLRNFCDSALMLEKGTATFFDSVEDGLKSYREVIAA